MRLSNLIYIFMIITSVCTSCTKEDTCRTCPVNNGPRFNVPNVFFYTSAGCDDENQVLVTVDGKDSLQVITVAGIPDCGAPGTTAKYLPAGLHKWKAYCNTTQMIAQGVFEVTPGNCQVVEIK